MKNFSRTSLLIFSAAVLAMVVSTTLVSNSSQPGPGYANEADNLSNCATCHSGNATTDNSKFLIKMSTTQAGLANGTVTSSTTYIPGQTYWMTMQLENNTVNAKRFGFQIASLDANNQPAGSFTATNTTNTTVTTGTGPLAGRSYISHKNATGNKQWLFKWNAPANAGQGKVVLSYSAIYADSTGTNAGDNTFIGKVTISAQSVGINEPAGVGEVRVFPAHVHSTLNLYMDVTSAENVQATLYDMQGRAVKELLNESVGIGAFQRNFDVLDLAKGMYVVKVQIGKGSISQRIIKN